MVYEDRVHHGEERWEELKAAILIASVARKQAAGEEEGEGGERDAGTRWAVQNSWG